MKLTLSLRHKILITYLIVFILLSTLVANSLNKKSQIDTRLKRIEEGYVTMAFLVDTLEELPYLQQNFRIADLFTARSEPERWKELRSDYPVLIQKNLKEIERLLKFYAVPTGQKSSIAGVNQEVAKLLVVLQTVQAKHLAFQYFIISLEDVSYADFTQKLPILRLRFEEVRGAFRQALRSLARSVNSTIQKEVVLVSEIERKATYVTLAFTIAGGFVVLLLSLVAMLVLRPVKELTSGARKLREGDYHSRVNVKTSDEIGLLAQEFNQMAEAIAKRNEALEDATRHSLNIINSMANGLMVFDENSVIVSANAAFLTLSKMGDVCLEGKKAQEIPLLKKMGLVQAIDRAITSNANYFSEQRVVMADDEPEMTLECSVLPLRSKEGATYGAAMFFQDRTEIELIRRKLVQNEKLALIGKFSAQIAHEIRNPLNALGLNLDLLQEDIEASGDNTEIKEIFAAMKNEVARLKQVTQNYLDMVRPIAIPETEVSLGKLINETLLLMRSDMEGIEVVKDIEPRAEVMKIRMNRDSVKQVIVNLVNNAVESLPSAHGKIWIRLFSIENRLVFEIEDNGIGANQEEKNRMFEAFYTTKASGTGLGLAISQKIIFDHGAEIECRDGREGGLCFRIYFDQSMKSQNANSTEVEAKI